MGREELEHLLLEYANGSITTADMQTLEALFDADPLLRQEAEEMERVSRAMQQAGDLVEVSERLDSVFYKMLNDEKCNLSKKTGRVIVLTPSFVRLLLAFAACIAAFVIGRISVGEKETFQFKTVYVDRPVANVTTESVEKPTQRVIQQQNKNSISSVNAELYEQLRSVYASERIAAVTELSKRKDIDPEALRILGFALREDDNPNVRLMIVNVLQPLASQRKVQDMLISVLNRQEDALVQTSIVDLLVEAKSRQAIPQMIALMENKNTDVNVQEKIKDGIEKFLY